MSKPIYSESVIDFLTVCAEYCISLEKLSAEPQTSRDFLMHMTRILPLLYVKVTLLPVVEAMGEEDLPEHVDEAEYNFVRQNVWRLLQDKDNFLEVFTPDMIYSDNPIENTISENLADIYQDIKNFVAIYADQNEVNMNNAIVRVQETFREYWGQTVVNVLRPMHSLVYSGQLDDTEE